MGKWEIGGKGRRLAWWEELVRGVPQEMRVLGRVWRGMQHGRAGAEAVGRGWSEDHNCCFVVVFLVPHVVPGTK